MGCLEAVTTRTSSCIAAAMQKLSIPSRSESMAGVIILYVFTNSIATSIWMFNGWTPFIYLLFNKSNKTVGFMSATNGVFELSTAFLSGYLADKVLGPSKTLMYAVRFGICTMILVLVAVWSEQRWLLVVAQMFEGTYMGFSFTCVESVFAQCMPRGDRDRLYSIKFAFEASGPIAGLLLTIALFLVTGDDWQIPVLRNVITAGLLLHLASMVFFLLAFVPLQSHLDRRKNMPTTDVVVAEGRVCPDEPYEYEDSRLPGHEVAELELPPLYLSHTAKLINCARTAVLQARSPQPRIAAGYEPSVCTAHDHPPGGDAAERDAERDADAGSQIMSTLSFSSAPRAASTRAMSHGDNASFRQHNREGKSEGGEPGSPASPAGDSTASPQCGHAEEDNREIIGYVDAEYDEAGPCRQKTMDCFPLKRYPIFVALGDFVLSVGSGMTTQYFTLFMMEYYGIPPVLLYTLNLINSILIASMAIVNGYFGSIVGRVRAILPTRLVGTFILLYMALARDNPTAGTPHVISTWARVLMCAAYTVRNAFMNCSAGLSRSLIMDLVKEEQRGKWNAVESVQAAGWSGTALIGGFIADRSGYGAAFIVTFFFHLASGALLLPLTVRNDSRLPQPIYASEGAKEGANDKTFDSSSAGGADSGSSDYNPQKPQVVELTVANVMRIASTIALAPDHPVGDESGGAASSSNSPQRPSRATTTNDNNEATAAAQAD